MHKFLTIGIENIDKNKFVAPKNRDFIKPAGGLWASPYTPDEEYSSVWHEWCDFNMPGWIKEYGVVFELKSDTKILVIDSLEDLKNCCTKYGINTSLGKVLDFEKIAINYDCIFLTTNGEISTRYEHEYSLYGWDVESLLVLNIDCVFNSYKVNIDLPDIY